MYIDPDNLGFFGGAVVRMAGLAPPEPVFELEFPSMAKAVIGEESEVVVTTRVHSSQKMCAWN